MKVIEKIGTFFIGKEVSTQKKGSKNDEPINLNSKQLTTHAICVGMTGSGKTGLGITLLEEAGLDKIPALIIDPKGDLGDLLLTFPNLSPSDFLPWVDAQEAERKEMTPAAYSEYIAKTWKEGLASWGEGSERIQALRNAVDMAIYTPASRSGIPLSVLGSFTVPSKEIMQDQEALRDRIMSTTSGVLGLLGISADPVKSREHILISSIINYAWKEGKDLAITSLIQYVQKPPFNKIGALDIDTFFPTKERTELSISLNNLLASPGFQAWMEGETLDIQNLLYTKEGKPRLAILSIAHLSKPEQMFFVTILLNELLSWMRRQPGTTSLRALLYMDEIFGFFPPSSMPPSKIPMLTLLKQARAYGLGVVLATQNPVDLDYKGLANCGIWFIGRLQTERDKMRVLEGLAAGSNGEIDSATLNKMLAATGNRVFIMRSIYETKPILFETRWTLSYLKGPLTLSQIARLTKYTPEDKPSVDNASAQIEEKPVIPGDLPEFFGQATQMKNVSYKPLILGLGKLHYVDSKNKIDVWQDVSLLAPLDEEGAHVLWEEGDLIPDIKKQLEKEPVPNSSFMPLPAGATKDKNYKSFSKSLMAYLYQSQNLTLYHSPQLGIISKPEETEGEFRSRLDLLLREKRDEAIAKATAAYGDKIQTLQAKLKRAEDKVSETKQKSLKQKVYAFISFLTSLVSLFFGKKLTKTTINQTGTTIRRAGKITEGDTATAKAEDSYSLLQQQLEDLQQRQEEEKKEISEKFDSDKIDIESTKIASRKSDVAVDKIALVWWPKWTKGQ